MVCGIFQGSVEEGIGVDGACCSSQAQAACRRESGEARNASSTGHVPYLQLIKLPMYPDTSRTFPI